jgi:rare lipoprotein A (peptidoglycan hydrolase)
MSIVRTTPTASPTLFIRTARLLRAARLLAVVLSATSLVEAGVLTDAVAPVTSALAHTSAVTGGSSAGTSVRSGSPRTSAGTSRGAERKIHKANIATWFGPGLYGKTTACGQMLTPAVVGVANRTLPCGTLVRIGYRGRAVTVPVLDRGPYAHRADWDLTAGAAAALNITETVRVSARVVGSTPNTPALGAPAITPAETATGGAQAGG